MNPRIATKEADKKAEDDERINPSGAEAFLGKGFRVGWLHVSAEFAFQTTGGFALQHTKGACRKRTQR